MKDHQASPPLPTSKRLCQRSVRTESENARYNKVKWAKIFAKNAFDKQISLASMVRVFKAIKIIPVKFPQFGQTCLPPFKDSHLREELRRIDLTELQR